MKKVGIYIGITIALILGLAVWYLYNDDNSLKAVTDDEAIKPYAEIGEAETINDLSPKCTQVFKDWKNWLLSNPDNTWTKKLKKQAKEYGQTLTDRMEEQFITGFNNGDYYDKCNK